MFASIAIKALTFDEGGWIPLLTFYNNKEEKMIRQAVTVVVRVIIKSNKLYRIRF